MTISRAAGSTETRAPSSGSGIPNRPGRRAAPASTQTKRSGTPPPAGASESGSAMRAPRDTEPIESRGRVQLATDGDVSRHDFPGQVVRRL